MPELPEVETIRRQLDEVLSGQRVESVEVRREKSWQGMEPEGLVERKIDGIRRKGKMLIVRTDDRDANVLVHLKMTGQLVYQEELKVKDQRSKSQVKSQNFDEVKYKNHWPHFAYDHRIVGGHPSASWVRDLPDKHTRVVVGLERGTLYFNDMRVFGWMKLVDARTRERVMSAMPPDVIDKEVSRAWFYEKVLQRSRRAVKVVVMDSKLVGGVGNIYANDGLFDAGIDPRRPSNLLSKAESARLLESLQKVVKLGIKLGGATASDDKFVQTTGLGGKYQEHFLVYEREGETAKRNGKKGVIEKIKLGGRGTYFVPGLQS